MDLGQFAACLPLILALALLEGLKAGSLANYGGAGVCCWRGRQLHLRPSFISGWDTIRRLVGAA